MKKENIIVIFYVIYFSWLFTVAFLTPSHEFLNYFTISITLIYFTFIKEKGDLLWYWLSALLPILITSTSFKNFQIYFDITIFQYMPLWLPLAWGITIVALRKFYILVTR